MLVGGVEVEAGGYCECGRGDLRVTVVMLHVELTMILLRRTTKVERYSPGPSAF